MQQLNDYSDSRQNGWCIHCTNFLGADSNIDHVPSKSILRPPFPENLPVVEVCRSCNSLFSTDEEYFIVFLETVMAGSTAAPFHHNPKIARALARNSKLKAEIEGSKVEYTTISGEVKTYWKPNQEKVNRVIVKNAKGHALYKLGEPMLDNPIQIVVNSLLNMTEEQLGEFEFNNAADLFLLPEVGSRMLQRVLTGKDLSNGWITVQEGVYRYRVTQDNGLRVSSVIFEYLATDVFWDD